MRVCYKKGKIYNIPKDEIKNYMEKLSLSEEKAIELWLSDNGYLVNEEQEELDKKSNSIKIQHKAQEKATKSTKTRTKKPNYEKKAIIEALYKGILANIDEIENISITNDEKYIDLTINNVDYTINLIAHRRKGEKNA